MSTPTMNPQMSSFHPNRLATVRRIEAQLRNDPRTIGLVIVVPAVLLTLLYFVFSEAPTMPGQRPTFESVGPIMLAVLPMMLMFIVTSVVMLRERTTGTLERVLATPISRWNLIAFYAGVFAILATAQASVLCFLILWVWEVPLEGPWPVLILLAVMDALFGVAFGLLASAFAHTEFQAVQFMPLFIGPQIFLCGLFLPKELMPSALESVSNFLPMTWAVDVVRELMTAPTVSTSSRWELAALAAAIMVSLILAATTMRRQTR